MPLWLYWILLGLVAGTLAKFLVPGRDPSGCIITILLGIIGAFIGGWLGTRFFGWGTVVAVDHRYRQHVGPDDVAAIVEELRAGS